MDIVIEKSRSDTSTQTLALQYRKTGITIISLTNVFNLFDEHNIILDVIFAKIL